MFYLCAAVALAGEALLVRALLGERGISLRRWITAAGVLLLAGIPGISSTAHLHLNEHPLLIAGREYLSRSVAGEVERRRPIQTPVELPGAAVDHDPRLGRLLASGLGRRRRPNVVVVILESVGARNLLNDAGFPSPLLAPNLARLAQSGVTFGSFYAPFPSTVRSLINLHTGGRMPTGSGAFEIEHRYLGPMLGRAMRGLGYGTALFSSERLDVEACDTFLKQGDYDRFQDFEQDLAKLDPANLIHSWGAREEHTLGLIEEWVGDVRAAGKPFYLEYMTVATHHPYGVPPGYRGPFAGVEDQSKYHNSLHYTDAAIGNLVSMLTRQGLLDDTLLVVTGDHGEAHGDAHPGNFLHKSFLYEENVREFLLLWDPAWKLAAPLISDRVSSNSDVMPNLLAYLGAPDPSLPGRNLLAETYAQPPVFLLKNTMPEQWGFTRRQMEVHCRDPIRQG